LSCSGIATGIVVKHPITRVTSNRYLVCFALAVAFVLGIATFVCGGSQRSTFALHETYAIIFLAVTILLGIHVVFQIMAERATLSKFLFSSSSGSMQLPSYHPHRTGHPTSNTQNVIQNIHPMPDPHSAAHPRDLLHPLDQPLHIQPSVVAGSRSTVVTLGSPRNPRCFPLCDP